MKRWFCSIALLAPLALASIAQWPLRAALTAFGILIGVAAVVVTVALGEGTEVAVKKRLDRLGQNTLTIVPQQAPASGVEREGFQPRLTESDGEAISREAPSVLRVAPVLASRGNVSFGGYTISADLVGTNRAFRQKVWQAFSQRGDNGNANDNNALIAKIVKLRADRAKLRRRESLQRSEKFPHRRARRADNYRFVQFRHFKLPYVRLAPILDFLSLFIKHASTDSGRR